VASAEAKAIDGLAGDRLLRLHVVGHCRTNAAARIVGAATDRYARRGMLPVRGHLDARRFRLCCEGEVCYEGYFVKGGDSQATGLEPLTDFGMPNAGCTAIEYFQGGQWQRLELLGGLLASAQLSCTSATPPRT
jgi:hypothetical protein